ncbi:MAG: MnhB domain-containing protein [Rubrobacteraceae bacterium]
MKGVREGSPGGVPEGVTSVMTRTVARLLLIPTMVTAAAILVKGYVEPGDGFSAGVIVSLGILMQYLAFGREQTERLLPLRGVGYLAFLGLLLTLVIAFRPLFFGEPLMTHWPPPGADVIYFGTLEIITAVAFDIGIFLLVVGYGTGTISLIARLVGRIERSTTQEEHQDPDEAFGEGRG